MEKKVTFRIRIIKITIILFAMTSIICYSYTLNKKIDAIQVNIQTQADIMRTWDISLPN